MMNNQLYNCFSVLLIVILLSQTSKAWTQEILKYENFDNDPGWDAVRNRIMLNPVYKQQNFGYQETNYAGSEPGEIGGVVWRSITPAYYGKIVGPFSLEDPLSASGKVAIREARTGFGWQTGSSVFVGFFNHSEQGWRPINFLGFRLETHTDTEAKQIEKRPGIEVCYGTQKWTAGGAHINSTGEVQERNVKELDQDAMFRIAPDGTKHTWEFAYNPKGEDGSAEIRITLDGVVTLFPISGSHRDQGASFDRFGIFNNQIPGQEMEVYFDDISINGEIQDLSRDPGWENKGNCDLVEDRSEYGTQDYGFSPTNFAGGRLGELGGRFFSVDPWEKLFQGYYGDRVGLLTLEYKLLAQGRFAASDFSIDSTFALGWFNSTDRGWPLKNFVGIYFDSLSDTGRIIQPLYGTSEGNSDRNGGYVTFDPDGTTYEWTMEYNPAGAQGRGTIMFSMNNQSVTRPMAPGDKEKGAFFDRFGVFNLPWANSKHCTVFLDDLVYTVSTLEQSK